MMTLQESLGEAGIKLRSYRAGTVQYSVCPACVTRRKKANQKKLCLSVKIDEGSEGGAVWLCHNCGWSGNVKSRSGAAAAHAISAAPARPADRHEALKPEGLYKTFKKWGISRDTVDFLHIHGTRQWFPQLEREDFCVAFPYIRDGATVNHKYRHPKKHFRQDKDAEKILYNIDSLRDAQEVIFCEGEKDVAAILEALGAMTACTTLPDGAPKEGDIDDPEAKRLQPIRDAAEVLAPVKKFILAGDADAAGAVWLRALAKCLSPVRCWVVVWPAGCKDAQETLQRHGPDMVRGCIELATGYPLEGIYTLQRGELFAFRDSPAMKVFEIGEPALDPWLKLRPGQVMTVSGYPGDGKSSWVDWLAVQMTMRFGWKWAVYTPEHGVDEHAAQLAEKFIGQPFVQYRERSTPRMTDDELARAEAWVRANWTYIVPRDEPELPTLEWLLQKGCEAVIRSRIKGLIIDPYSKVRSESGKGLGTDYVAGFMSRLLGFATHHDLLVILVAHPAKISRDSRGRRPVPSLHDISGSAHFFNATNLGVVIHRPKKETAAAASDDHTDDGNRFAVDVHIQKVKRKDQGGIRVVGMVWNPDSGRYYGRPA